MTEPKDIEFTRALTSADLKAKTGSPFIAAQGIVAEKARIATRTGDALAYALKECEQMILDKAKAEGVTITKWCIYVHVETVQP